MEYVDPHDAMFIKLLGARENLYTRLTVDTFLSVFLERFELLRQASITQHRTLLILRKRS